ncbi:MAG: DNA repair protein RadC [Clostridia bacterium]|nr:DNA repair protein RadC [Clostridia bacterium]
MYIKKLPEQERPVEKLKLMGREALSTEELIAVLLHSGNKDKSAINLARDLINFCQGDLKFLTRCELEELEQIEGIGPMKGASIIAACELGKRISLSSAHNQYISNVEDAACYLMEEMRYLSKEYFKTLLLDGKGKILGVDTVSIGDAYSTLVNPREVFVKAVKKGAASIIISHNHPSGDPKPSQEDLATTKRLVETGKILGIPVIDHLIIGDGKYTSFKEKGLL